MRRERSRRPRSLSAVLGLFQLETRDVPTFYGNQLFPLDNPWNQIVSAAPVADNSVAIINRTAAMALFNAFMISVIERRREIGVLRAMGASRGYIAKSILIESSSTALLGGVLGLLTSVVVHRLGTLIMSTVTNITVQFAISPLVLLNVVVAVILCWSGALLPASRASKSKIVDALEVA